MIPALAAQSMLKLFALPDAFQKDPEGKSLDHILFMLYEIATEEVQHEKAHRWLGYAQGLLVCYEKLTLEQCKQINLEA